VGLIQNGLFAGYTFTHVLVPGFLFWTGQRCIDDSPHVCIRDGPRSTFMTHVSYDGFF
jgi:hypothetical protein